MLCGRLSSFTKQVFLRIWLNSLAGTYPLKFNNRNTSARCEICPKLTIKTLERRQWHRSVVNIATTCSAPYSTPIVNFKNVIADWV